MMKFILLFEAFKHHVPTHLRQFKYLDFEDLVREIKFIERHPTFTLDKYELIKVSVRDKYSEQKDKIEERHPLLEWVNAFDNETIVNLNKIINLPDVMYDIASLEIELTDKLS